MVDQKIVDFIKKMLKDGISLNTIKSQLKERGWPENEINEAIQSAIPSETPVSNLETLPKEPVKEKPKNYYKIILLILLLLILVSLSVWFGMKGIVKILEEKGQANLLRSTEETAKVQEICTNDVMLSIKSVCKSEEGYKILVENTGKENIKQLRVFFNPEFRVREVGESFSINTPVLIHGTALITIKPTTLTEVRQITIVKIIEKDGKSFGCTPDAVSSYGDSYGDPITTPC